MTAGRRPLIAGNWKMNGLRDEGIALAEGLKERAEGLSLACDLLVCPPATLIREVVQTLAGSVIVVGAQDCHAVRGGAHTGDISARMLRDAGCAYVILGHSERRNGHFEKDADVRAKAAAAHAAGLNAIICIGESEGERDQGDTLRVVISQLSGSLPEGAEAGNTVIAYEPVWAIGTGRTPTAEDVAEVHARIREGLGERLPDSQAVRLLYGGSVNPGNARELLNVENVDGALVGGASLEADDFWAIVESRL